MKHGKLFLAAFSVFFLLSTDLFAGSVTGTLTTANNNWGTGGNVTSPVAITGNIIVPQGTTLTIQPGCVVTGASTVTINGILLINGTVDKYVDWSAAKFVFAANSGPSKLQFIKIISYTSPNVIFPNSIDVTNANVDFEHVEIQDFGTYGINIAGASSVVKINFCTIGAKSRTFSSTLGLATAVNIAADAAAADITIANSILGVENGNAQMAGLAVRGTATNTKVSYTFIVGTRTGAGSTETSVYTGVTPGVFDIPNTRFFLSDLAPAVDAADPADQGFANEPAPNGGRTDCGFYGGTSQATRSLVQVRIPAIGQSLTHGAQVKVSWWGGRFATTKKVDYSTDSGTSWTAIGTAPVGDTSIMWTVPSVKTGKGLVRVAYTSVATVSGISGRFYIDSVPPVNNVCDPNRVLKNPKYFACIPYSGYRGGSQSVEPTYQEVRQDMTILSQYTHGIRTYGTSWRNNTNIGQDYLPHMCDTLNLNLYLGIWIDNSYGDAVNLANCDVAITVVNQNHKSIKSIIVGNEYLLRVEQAHGNMATAEANLIKYINYVKGKLPAGSKIKVTTGESYPDWLTASNALPAAVDIIYWHVHPWWEGKAINVAAEWAATAHQKMKDRMAQAGVTKQLVLAETGYPWGATQGAAVGTEANQAQYLKDLNAYCFKTGLEYFFFEGFDEPWKASFEGGVGDKWGMWKVDRTPHLIMQNIATLIPDCMKWEDPENPSTIVNEPKTTNIIKTMPPAYNRISIFNLQGKLLAKLASNHRGFTNVGKYLHDGRFAAGTTYICSYTKNNVITKTEKIVVR